jgi:AcrR family transcriptional regulator
MSTAGRPAAGQSPAGADGPTLRRDAERNRERIITAARRVFAAGGLDASMASVARAADVGIATLFRRFPTREDLINAVFADTMSAYVDAVTTALADPDPWHGFTAYIRAVCAMQAADRGFAEVLTMTFPAATHLEDQRQRSYRGFLRLIARAKNSGRLRPDFASQDLVILLIANAGVIAATHAAAPDAWQRLVGYMIQAFTAPQPATLPAPPDPGALARAMLGPGCAGSPA